MNKDTYEFEITNKSLEQYEWDDLWRIEAYDQNTPRLFSIGDSISRGYRHFLADAFRNVMCVDNFATSKAVDNPWLLKMIHLSLEQLGNCKVILFNNGLHGWHLNEEEYRENYDAIISELCEKYLDIKIVIALSTPTRKNGEIKLPSERINNIIKRNEYAVSIAEKYNLPYVDLYSVLVDKLEYYINDGVHLNEKGYKALAREIYKKINELLQNENKNKDLS